MVVKAPGFGCSGLKFRGGASLGGDASARPAELLEEQVQGLQGKADD